MPPPGTVVYLSHLPFLPAHSADVDDLKKGAGGEFVDTSVVILVCCTRRYFQSQACAREILRAVLRGKPLVALIEPEARHGAFSIEEIKATLSDDAWAYSWGLEGEMAALGYPKMPTGEELVNALFADFPIEWNRFSALQVQTDSDSHFLVTHWLLVAV